MKLISLCVVADGLGLSVKLQSVLQIVGALLAWLSAQLFLSLCLCLTLTSNLKWFSGHDAQLLTPAQIGSRVARDFEYAS